MKQEEALLFLNLNLKYNLFTSTVGSHMWGMQRVDSDTDLFNAYVVDTDEILLGRHPKGFYEKKDNVDFSSYEIGQVIRELLRGNVNFLWGVTSPIVKVFQQKEYRELYNIVVNNLSKNYFHSIKGMAKNNLKKYFGVIYKDGKFYDHQKYKIPFLGKKWHKKCALIGRSLIFGTRLLKGEISYKITGLYPLLTVIVNKVYELERTYNKSKLPEKPDRKPFEDYLVKIRKKVMNLG